MHGFGGKYWWNTARRHDMSFQIELEEAHIKVLTSALEMYSRAQMGQFKYALEQINEYAALPWETQGFIENTIKSFVFPELTGNMFYGIHSSERPDSARVAFDMYQVLRHQLWKERQERGDSVSRATVDAHPAMATSTEQPLISIHVDKRLYPPEVHTGLLQDPIESKTPQVSRRVKAKKA